MPICSGCDENVTNVSWHEVRGRMVELCPMGVHEREEDEPVEPRSSSWVRWAAIVALLAFLVPVAASIYSLFF